MGENITKIKVGDDVRCISLDTEAIDTSTIGFGGDGKLGVRLGSSVYAAQDGIGVKIHPDTRKYLQLEPSGFSLKLDTMAEAMADAVGKKLGLAIDGYNKLVIGTKPLQLGTGLKGGDDGHTLALNIGSGLAIGGTKKSIHLKVDEGQQLLIFMPDGTQTFNLNKLYSLLEARYNLTKK